MRTNKYYGTFWIIVEGKTEDDDDRLSIKIENQWRTKPTRFDFFSVNESSYYFEITILNFNFSFF